MKGKDDDIQDAILTGSRFQDVYPKRAEIYSSWIEELRGLGKEDQLLTSRIRSAKSRIGSNRSIRRGLVASEIVLSADLWSWNESSLPSPTFLADVDAIQDREKAQTQFLERVADVRVMKLLGQQTSLRCPFAGRGCSGETHRCTSTFDNFGELPDASCLLRYRYRLS